MIVFGKGKHKKINLTKKEKIIFAAAVAAAVIVVALILVFVMRGNGSKQKDAQVSTSVVTRGNVEATISGSGSLQPNERYEVIPLVNGEIINAPYDVGDYVEEGAVVYEFDTTDARVDLEKQRNSMQKSTITYNESLDQKDDLIIKATCSGVVQDINIKQGDDISAGQQITEIINTQDLKIKLPFNQTQLESISEGDTAVITSSEAMSSIGGTVTNISSTPHAESDGTSLYDVTIEFQNPGAISAGDIFGGSINDIVSPGSGTVSYTADEKVSSKIAGTVATVYCNEGDYVKEGDVLVRLTSETVNNALQKSKIEYNDAKLSLQNQENTLDDYKLTAPISGTVLTKTSKVGDTIDRSNSSVTMMVIGDVSKLKFTLSIDELDISKVALGQTVNVTADAIEGKTFEGEITEIAMEGVASNGVTTYEAVVTINDPQELKPSMNVDAVVVIESVQDVLMVPSSDITTAMGRSFVFVKDDGKDKKNKNSKEDEIKEAEISEEYDVQPIIEDADMPGDFTDNDVPKSHNDMPNREGERPERDFDDSKSSESSQKRQSHQRGENNSDETRKSKMPEAPEGFKTVEIITGVVGDEYTEVISGLSEGQEIYQKQVTSSNTGMMFGMGGMPGGMGGGMPGGMSGGMGGGQNRGGMGGGPR